MYFVVINPGAEIPTIKQYKTKKELLEGIRILPYLKGITVYYSGNEYTVGNNTDYLDVLINIKNNWNPEQ